MKKETKLSKLDLINLKTELQFINEFHIELYEVIDIIEELQNSTQEQINEWQSHLITNYSLTQKEEFTLRLINRFKGNRS